MIRAVLRLLFYIIMAGIIAYFFGLLIWYLLMGALYFMSIPAHIFGGDNALKNATYYVHSDNGYYLSYTVAFMAMMFRLPAVLRRRKKEIKKKFKVAAEAKAEA